MIAFCVCGHMRTEHAPHCTDADCECERFSETPLTADEIREADNALAAPDLTDADIKEAVSNWLDARVCTHLDRSSLEHGGATRDGGAYLVLESRAQCLGVFVCARCKEEIGDYVIARTVKR